MKNGFDFWFTRQTNSQRDELFMKIVYILKIMPTKKRTYRFSGCLDSRFTGCFEKTPKFWRFFYFFEFLRVPCEIKPDLFGSTPPSSIFLMALAGVSFAIWGTAADCTDPIIIEHTHTTTTTNILYFMDMEKRNCNILVWLWSWSCI